MIQTPDNMTSDSSPHHAIHCVLCMTRLLDAVRGRLMYRLFGKSDRVAVARRDILALAESAVRYLVQHPELILHTTVGPRPSGAAPVFQYRPNSTQILISGFLLVQYRLVEIPPIVDGAKLMLAVL